MDCSKLLGSILDLFRIDSSPAQEEKQSTENVIAPKKWILDQTDPSLLAPLLTPSFVKDYGLKPEDIPDSLLTEDLVLNCLKFDQWYYHKLPDRLKNNSFNQACIDQKGYSILSEIPDHKALKINYEKLLKTMPYALNYIPAERQTLDMCRTVLKHHHLTALEYVSPDIPGLNDLLRNLLVQHPDLYLSVPIECVTEEMVRAAEKKALCCLSMFRSIYEALSDADGQSKHTVSMASMFQ